MKRKRLQGMVVLVLAVVTVGLLVGCQSQPQTPVPTTSPAAAAPAAQPASTAAPTAAPETIKVGIQAMLTGPAARIGISFERYVRMGIDDVNARGIHVGGKTYQFNAVTVDDKNTPEGGREAANRLVLAEKVKFIIGGASTAAAGEQPVTEPNKVLMMAAGAEDGLLGPQSRFTMLVGNPPPAPRYPILYQWFARAHPEVKTLARIYGDDVTGQRNISVTDKAAKAAGLTFVSTEKYPLDTKDFNPLVTRVLRTNPDAIEIGPTGAYAPLFSGLMTALYDQGYRKPIFGTSADIGTLKAGGPAYEGYAFMGLADYNAPIVGAQEKEIIQRQIKAYGADSLETILLIAYNSPSILAQAMEKAGSVDDTEKIVQVMRENKWDTIYGKQGFGGVKTYGAAQILEYPIYMSKYEGGKIVTFDKQQLTVP